MNRLDYLLAQRYYHWSYDTQIYPNWETDMNSLGNSYPESSDPTGPIALTNADVTQYGKTFTHCDKEQVHQEKESSHDLPSGNHLALAHPAPSDQVTRPPLTPQKEEPYQFHSPPKPHHNVRSWGLQPTSLHFRLLGLGTTGCPKPAPSLPGRLLPKSRGHTRADGFLKIIITHRFSRPILIKQLPFLSSYASFLFRHAESARIVTGSTGDLPEFWISQVTIKKLIS